MTTLDGRHVLVLGATGGLGAAICSALAAEGARLTVSARSRERLDELAGRLGDAVVGSVPADLRDPAAPSAVVDAATSGGTGLGGVVYAAGVVAFGGVEELDDAVLDEVLVTNLVAPIRLARAAVPRMDRDSFLLNISAITAERPTAGMAAYSASKGGLTAFDTAARIELRKRGIRVVDVRPPHTETGLAGRPIAGTAPHLTEGIQPEAVAKAVVEAITADRREVASGDFG